MLLLPLLSGCFYISVDEYRARLDLARGEGGEDTGTDTDAIPEDCDADDDGDEAPACGGTDCDDADATVSGNTGLAVPATYATVQEAVDAAANGDTVCVAAGRFPGTVTLGKQVTIAGLGPDLTVLDAQGAGSVVSHESPTIPALRGLTLTGGSAPYGAGLYVHDGGITLEDVRITGNSCTDTSCYGAGAFLLGTLDIRGLEVSGNTTTLVRAASPPLGGFGLYITDASGSITDTVVRDNALDATSLMGTTQLWGGGVMLVASAVSIDGLDILDNTLTATLLETSDTLAVTGTGIAFSSDRSTVDRLHVRGNSASVTGGTVNVYGGAIALVDAHTDIAHARIEGNMTDVGTTLGVAVYAQRSDVSLTNTLLLGNQATDENGSVQGLLHLTESSDTTLVNVDIVGNSIAARTARGGALYIATSGVTELTNVSVVDTTLPTGGTGGVTFRSSSGVVPTYAYCNFHDNGTMPFSQGGAEDASPVGSGGNIEVAPTYADVGGADPAAWDLHLGAGSALRDAGTPSITDADGSRSDIGGYGGPGGDW